MRTPTLLVLFVLAIAVPIRAQISGRIIDERTGQGVPAARITLLHDSVLHETLTDAQGRYTFAQLTPAEYYLAVHHLAYHRAQLRVLVTEGHKLAVDVVIAPQPIEARLKSHPVIAEAIVIGEGRKFVAALFVPSDPATADSAESRALFQAALDDVNRDLGQFEKLKKYGLLPKPLSQADGELTPTLKVKRKVIEQKYRDVIEKLYAN